MLLNVEDTRLIERILAEYDPAERLASIQARDMMPAAEWNLVMDELRSDMRLVLRCAVLEIGIRNLFQAWGYDGHASRHDLLWEMRCATGWTRNFDDPLSDAYLKLPDSPSPEIPHPSDELSDAQNDNAEQAVAAVRRAMGFEPSVNA